MKNEVLDPERSGGSRSRSDYLDRSGVIWNLSRSDLDCSKGDPLPPP